MQTFEDYLYDHVEESRLNKLGDEEYKRHANAFAVKVKKESIERAIEVVEKNIGTKVNGEGTADYKLALLNAFNGGVKISLEALKTLLH